MVELITKNLELESLSDTTLSQQAFDDLLNANIEGIIFRGFFPVNVISEIMDGCRQALFSEINAEKGGTFPFSFAEFNWTIPNAEADYMSECAKGREKLTQLLGDKALGILTLKLADTFSKYRFSTAGQNTTVAFLPYTVRYTSPGAGHIRYHCENQSLGYFDKLFNQLSAYMQVRDMFSVFTPLQCGDSGGELSVYNEYWQGADTVEKQYEKLNNFDKSGLNPNQSIKKLKIALSPGDVILFNAGRVWHFVEDVKGANPRITLGAFGGRSKLNANEIVLWS